MIAQEAKYHPTCLRMLYHRASQVANTSGHLTDHNANHGLAFAQTTEHIKNQRESKESAVFKLSNLTKLYSRRLEIYGELIQMDGIIWCFKNVLAKHLENFMKEIMMRKV